MKFFFMEPMAGSLLLVNLVCVVMLKYKSRILNNLETISESYRVSELLSHFESPLICGTGKLRDLRFAPNDEKSTYSSKKNRKINVRKSELFHPFSVLSRLSSQIKNIDL